MRFFVAMTACACAVAGIAASRPSAAQPYRGSAALEPGLAGRSDILLFEDFEATDWESHWTGTAGDFAAASDIALGGQQSLVVRVPAGAHDGCSLDFGFADAGLEEPEEIYFRYYVHFDSSWELANDGEIGKLPGISGTYGVAGWGGRPADGTNGWSARMMNFDTGPGSAVGFYTYHADMTDTYGTHMRWSPDLERNRWYCIEAYVRMNSLSASGGANDGVLRGTIDGVLAFEKTDVRFRDVAQLRIEQIWFNVYVGGSWVADHDMQLHFDNVVVARNPIGCLTTAGDGGVPPGADGGSDSGTGGASAGGTGGSASGGDAGKGGSGNTGNAGSAGSGATGPKAEPSADSGDEGGCGCRTISRPSRESPSELLGALLMLAALPYRRRAVRRKHIK